MLGLLSFACTCLFVLNCIAWWMFSDPTWIPHTFMFFGLAVITSINDVVNHIKDR